MYANYHTHTFRCFHASGTEEEYIKRAIDGGIKIMGFSEHAPFPFSADHHAGWRMRADDAQNYISTLLELREKYKDKIKIHIGFEMEYYPQYFDDMFNYVKDLGAEFLILGEHIIGDENSGRYSYSGVSHTEEELIEYTDCIIEGMKTGKYIYVAHPDVLSYFGNRNIYEREARRLCNASKKLDIPLEINFLGINDNRTYPNMDFMKVAGEIGCKMIFGFDAHSPDRAYDDKSLLIAKDIVKAYNLNLIDSIEIKGLD